tara:strand:- start:4 stop:210 length:207 start_codon:yes stop_codon:yes gene_type:complete
MFKKLLGCVTEVLPAIAVFIVGVGILIVGVVATAGVGNVVGGTGIGPCIGACIALAGPINVSDPIPAG